MKNRKARRAVRRSKRSAVSIESKKSVSTANTDQISPALRKVCDELRALLWKADVNDAKARYAIGEIVLRVIRDKKTHGEGAIETLAKELAYDDSTLRSYANVAETWPNKSAFENLLARKNARGLPLRISHFIVLAQEVADQKKRDEWLEVARRDSLSVRKLEALVKKNKESPSAEDDHDEKDGFGAVEKMLRESVARWEGEASQVQRQTEYVIHLAQKNPTPRVQELMRRCAAEQRALAKSAAEAAEKLDSFLRGTVAATSGRPENPAVAHG